MKDRKTTYKYDTDYPTEVETAGPEDRKGTAYISASGWLPPSEFPAFFKGLCEAAGLDILNDPLAYMFTEVDAAFDRVTEDSEVRQLADDLGKVLTTSYGSESRRTVARALYAAGYRKSA